MTIVLDTKTKKIFSLFYGEADNFKKTQIREISLEEAREDCKHGDYIKIGPLDVVLKEHQKDDG